MYNGDKSGTIDFLYRGIDKSCWQENKSSLSLHQRKEKENNNHKKR